jgi:hypothetical protein
MPDPIQTIDSSSYPPIASANAEENSGQVCLSPALPNASASASASASAQTVPADASPVSPAVNSLVARFSPPIGSHPPVEPSLARAIEHCSWEVANAALGIGAVLVTPVGLAATLLNGARSLVSIGTAERCIERDVAKQIAEGETANQAADCERDGAIPLTKAGGSVICARP